MKKTLAWILAIILVCGSLIACSGTNAADPRVVGTWKLTKGIANGMTFDESEMKEKGVEMSLELKANGKAVVVNNGETSESANWKFENDVVTIYTTGSSQILEFAYDGEVLTYEQSGIKMIFEKK